MRSYGLSGLVAGLLVGIGSIALPLNAHNAVIHTAVRADNILLTLKLDTLNRESTSTLCRVAITQALREEEFNVVTDRGRADVELVIIGGIITITQGRAGHIGEAKLSYSAELKDMRGHSIISMVEDAEGESAAEACTEAASDIIEELEEAFDD